mmetsp:Transcript_35459/g.105876  ORF Transcript_35459/g.105876 Transcript_35459/m.105876 type:complete len:547 (-) Transcript_35459:270-1910(-)
MAPLPEDIAAIATSPETEEDLIQQSRVKDPPVQIDWEGGSDMDGSAESETFQDASDAESAPDDVSNEEKAVSSPPEKARAENADGGADSEKAAKSSEECSTVEKSFGRLTWDLCNRLRCVGCGNAASAPVHQCSEGHVLCLACSKSLSDCPSKGCEAKIGRDLPVNTALSALAEQSGATVPCRNKACDWRVPHTDLARHEKYCVFIRKGLMSPSLTPKKKVKPEKEVEQPSESPDEILSKGVRTQLNCTLCNQVAPAPVLQCRSGHVACYYCLGRLQKFDHPQCPLCSVPLNPGDGEEGRGSVVWNAHLEGLASFDETMVSCRYEGCKEEVRHDKLAEHLRNCEHQPIKCIHCTVEADGSAPSAARQERTYLNWDRMWEHYQEDHLPHYPPTSLDGIVVQSEMIQRMIDGEVDFVTWGHCLDPSSGEPVRVFPGLFYDEGRDVFYFNVRVMGPIRKGETCGMSVGPFAIDPTDSTSSHISLEARMPPTSYRVGYFENADLGAAAKMVRERPCLVLSGPTVRCLLESSGGDQGGSLCFHVSVPESMK